MKNQLETFSVNFQCCVAENELFCSSEGRMAIQASQIHNKLE